MSDSINVDFHPENKTALQHYLLRKTDQYFEISGQEWGSVDIDNLKFDIEKTFARTKRFFDDDGMDRDSQLVVGKVQSGKTAHLLGVISALVDSKCSLCVLISGITGALNRQTKNRLEEDLGTIEGHPVSIHPLPTLKDLPKTNVFDDVKDKVKLRIQAQREGGYLQIPSLPVIALLETKPRVEALERLIKDFREEFGKEFIVVIIDDEADQASQNTLASVRDESKIFEVIKRIRKSKARNYLLSYTATPHAILMTEKEGLLRPRICSMAHSGSQYFGLQQLIESSCPTSRMVVSDLPTDNQIEPPDSLRSAVLKFLLKSLVLREAPEIFFGCDEELSNIPINNKVKSSQMLVHPSSKVTIHDDYYTWINDKIIKDFMERLGHGSFPPKQDFVLGELATAYSELRSEIGLQGEKLPPNLPDNWVNLLAVSVSRSTKLLVVNSSPDRKTTDIELPYSNADWTKFQNWIVIGGDILGRGVTIPHLTTTYFLRNPKTPQFDTSSQQMRFCGYRRKYASFVSVYAPIEVLEQFSDLQDTDFVLHAMAQKWDNEETDLLKNQPGICFVKRAGSKITPTRRGVLDPSVRSEQIKRIAFQNTNYANPYIGRNNASKFCEHLKTNFKPNFNIDDWQKFEDVPHRLIVKLVNDLSFQGSDIRNSKRISMLLDDVLGKFSLLDTPVSIVTRNLDLLHAMSQGLELNRFFDNGMSFRGCPDQGLSRTDESLRDSWNQGYKNVSGIMKTEWYDSGDFGPLVGDSERSQQDRMNIGGSMLLVAPYSLVIRRENAMISPTIGFGIGIMFLSPIGREIEIEGF